jgi:O-antigen/teichoic acid export membrane protein
LSNPYKKLGGQALVYGLGNIIPRILNYAVLTVYYTRRFPPEKYGIITELYAYVAILLVILTYGMETGLFKFSNNIENKDQAYASILTSVILTSAIFALLVVLFNKNVAGWIGYKGNPGYIVFLGFTLSLDAISSIIFAKLRIENKVRRFAIIKIVNVLVTVVLVFFFLEFLPKIHFIVHSFWYKKYLSKIDIGYVFIANLMASLTIIFMMIKDFSGMKLSINKMLLKKVLLYSLPLLVSGLAGIFNESLDRILLRQFSADKLNALYELGIYGANYRIAVLMTIFVQMFRYAAEPFFFNLTERKDSKVVYANILKYFTIFLMIIFLGVALCIDFFKLFIDSSYYEGLKIVPVVLMANVLVGILFNVNMWYKISGHTMYGVYITGFGALITIIFNILLIPNYGYYACAWIHLVTNGIMLLLTYYFGQKVYRINYDIRRIVFYIIVGLFLYFIGSWLRYDHVAINLIIGAGMVIIYFLFCNRKEHLISIFIKKNED